jgi:hypothetical protein
MRVSVWPSRLDGCVLCAAAHALPHRRRSKFSCSCWSSTASNPQSFPSSSQHLLTQQQCQHRQQQQQESLWPAKLTAAALAAPAAAAVPR